MKKLSVVLGLALSISSVSNAFCLKQYSKNMNRYTAGVKTNAQQNNYAVASQASASAALTSEAVVRRQK